MLTRVISPPLNCGHVRHFQFKKNRFFTYKASQVTYSPTRWRYGNSPFVRTYSPSSVNLVFKRLFVIVRSCAWNLLVWRSFEMCPNNLVGRWASELFFEIFVTLANRFEEKNWSWVNVHGGTKMHKLAVSTLVRYFLPISFRSSCLFRRYLQSPMLLVVSTLVTFSVR